MDGRSQLFHQDIAISNSERVPFVYGFIDLFSGSGESWNWGFGMDEYSGMNSSVPPHTADGSKSRNEVQEKNVEKHVKPLLLQDTKQASILSPTAKLHLLEEESEESNKSLCSSDSSKSSQEKLLGNGDQGENEVSDAGLVLFNF